MRLLVGSPKKQMVNNLCEDIRKSIEVDVDKMFSKVNLVHTK